jgi:hypothetical protein
MQNYLPFDAENLKMSRNSAIMSAQLAVEQFMSIFIFLLSFRRVARLKVINCISGTSNPMNSTHSNKKPSRYYVKRDKRQARIPRCLQTNDQAAKLTSSKTMPDY